VTYTASVSGVKDAAGNAMTTPVSWQFTTVAVPVPTVVNAGIFDPAATPATASASDGTAVELGVKFRAEYDGFITGVRFYKGAANAGTHVGHVWSSTGTLIATATFTRETATGWQQVAFDNPVPITRGATYVASYFAPSGGYAVTANYFAAGGVDNGALHALPNSVTGGNGVFTTGTGFPSQTFNATNYWVDVVYTTVSDIVAPTVTLTTPASGATGVAVSSALSVTFSEAVRPETIAFTLRDFGDNDVSASLSYDAATRVATITPAAALSGATAYTATISGARDTFGNTMAGTTTWSFTTASVPVPTIEGATLFAPTATPANVSASDTSSTELGVKFQADYNGYITGIRFFKGAVNTGTHVGHLWTSTGTLLASATFINETATGWQQVNFSAPVPITAGTTYVASYLAPNGGYASNAAYFTTGVNSGALHAPASTATAGNGVYRYGTGQFPNSSYNATNYWVDPVYSTVIDTTAPTVTAKTPAAGATGLASTIVASATFSEAVQPGSISFVLRDAANSAVPATVTYDAPTRIAMLTPTSPLAPGTTYTASVLAASDTTGNALSAPVSWSFTTGTTSIKQTTAADFLTGSLSGVEATNTAGGDVQLASVVSLQEDFNGTALAPTWTSTSWVPQGGGPFNVNVAGGVVSVAGAQALSTSTYTDKPLEGLVSFGATPYQHFGLATTFASVAGQYWAMFSTMGTTNTLFARVNNNGSTVDVSVGAAPVGFHLYRVQPITGGFQFYIDNVLKTTINSVFAAGTQLRAGMSSFAGTPQPALQVDWVKVSSYGSTGTFQSTVLDAGSAVHWSLIDWTATVPPGSSILVETRTGNVATPDGTWSGWTAASDGGAVGSPDGQYIQYRVTFTSTGGAATSVLQDILLSWG
jgi:hypothetical protein